MADRGEFAAELDPNLEERSVDKRRKRTLGNVRLRHHETKEIILVPTPSNDPNDPLNWSQSHKYYMAFVICIAMMMCNFLAAGPSIALVETAFEFFPNAPELGGDAINSAFSKVAYFFTTTALLQGTGNFIWVPLCNKYGRRPIYVISYAIYLGAAIWCIFERSYGGFLAARIIMGFAAGAAETIAPVSITDVFFLHERGAVMSLYNCFLSIGVAIGMVISGLITINHNWRVIYQVASAMVGLVLLLAFFTFPETAYNREPAVPSRSSDGFRDGSRDGSPDATTVIRISGEKADGTTATSEVDKSSGIYLPVPKKHSYTHTLKLFTRVYTRESLFKLFLRPFGLIFLPSVLWASMVQAATIGFLVAVSSNVARAFQETYAFEPYQIGLCFVAAIIGSLLGIPAGGHFGDRVADFFTRRNGGVRDPEMRLPAMILCLVTAPLALVLYGVGIEHKLHWMCPTIGLGLLNFAITQGVNVSLVYVIDAYRPIAGEVSLTVLGFKSLFGFLLSFYTNPWVDQSGYQDAYGAMAGISAAVISLWVPLFFWGKRIRHATWSWPVISYIRWGDDREVGE